MTGRTTLKPHIPLCELFYFCVLKLILFALKLSLVQQTGIRSSIGTTN